MKIVSAIIFGAVVAATTGAVATAALLGARWVIERFLPDPACTPGAIAMHVQRYGFVSAFCEDSGYRVVLGGLLLLSVGLGIAAGASFRDSDAKS